SGRFACWLSGARPEAFAPIARLLDHLRAPAEVRAAQESAERPVRQGVAVAIDPSGPAGPELRLYLHGRSALGADRYQSLRFRPGEAPRRATYAFHFLPETPGGIRPLDLVAPALQAPFAALLTAERLSAASGFWLRTAEDGAVDQVDLAFPWSPPAESLPGLADLAVAVGAPIEERWTGLPVRHVALPAGAAPPTVTLYASTPRSGPWPESEAALREQVCHGARARHRSLEEQLFSRLPEAPPPGAGGGALDGFYDGDVATWRAVLGPDLHYHAGIFDTPDPDPDDGAMEAALRRAVVDLHPFLPAGGRVYDIGCGWGGPLAMWIRDLGCVGLGLTESRAQFRHCAALGLPVRWGDAERTLPPGRFDAVVLLESLSHVRDKPRLLRTLRLFTRRLVMRVNCQDDAPAGPAFGSTMQVCGSADLRAMIEAAGFRILHFRDRRREALPSIAAWRRRLLAVPPGSDPHLETLRAWCARVAAAPEAWGRHNPLIEVVAE
ncbi:MAG: hypothetical protein QOJ16_501, partial [Acidobacteriota bacterium]|nr:hypothetical protein [Acidobacteriota bacterium]